MIKFLSICLAVTFAIVGVQAYAEVEHCLTPGFVKMDNSNGCTRNIAVLNQLRQGDGFDSDRPAPEPGGIDVSQFGEYNGDGTYGPDRVNPSEPGFGQSSDAGPSMDHGYGHGPAGMTPDTPHPEAEAETETEMEYEHEEVT